MKVKAINATRESFVGVTCEFTTIDVVALSAMRNEIMAVIDNHTAIEKHNAIPYDKRVDEEGNRISCPNRINLNDEQLKMLKTFINNIVKVYGDIAVSHVFEDLNLSDTEENYYDDTMCD